MTKVHCKNCDAVVEAEEQRHYVGFNVYLARCHYCNSVETEKTEEPLRGPKWERSVENITPKRREIIKLLEDMQLEQPDNSPWSWDQGWNESLKEAIQKIKNLST